MVRRSSTGSRAAASATVVLRRTASGRTGPGRNRPQAVDIFTVIRRCRHASFTASGVGAQAGAAPACPRGSYKAQVKAKIGDGAWLAREWSILVKRRRRLTIIMCYGDLVQVGVV